MVTSIVWHDHRVFVEYDGQTGDSEVLSVVKRIQSDERFDSLLEAFHDFSKCIACDHTESTLLEIAGLNLGASRSNNKLRIAVIATRDDIQEMIRSFTDLGYSPYPLELFDSRADADAWLTGAPCSPS